MPWQSIGFETYSAAFSTITAKVLVVGAGGSTFNNVGATGGGGGGGNVTYNSGYTISSTSPITVTVGNYVANNDGQSSVFGTITSIGGHMSYEYFKTYKGGNSGSGKLGAGDAYGAGGGGGDSANGTLRSHTTPFAGGNGGDGTQVTISGITSVYYGGGGGSAGPGTGGAGGGADGVKGDGSSAQNGTPNTGGGAGGSLSATGGNGGSGIVIVRYTSSTQRGTGGNQIYQVSGDWVHVFTASGTFTPTA